MKLPCFLLACSIAACNAQVGAQNIIKQRAKDLRDQNNTRQGVPPATQAPPQTQPAARPAPAVPTAAQQSMSRFQTGLAGIKAGSPVTEDQQQKLTSDLMGMAQGRTKPTAVTADKLAREMAAALGEKQLSSSARARLAQDLDGLLNPERYPQAKVPAIVDDIQSVFLSNGLEAKRATTIGELSRKLSSEVQGDR